MGVDSPWVIPKEKFCHPWLRIFAVAYQQTVLEIPGKVVAVKLRHDALLSASSHLFGMPRLWMSRRQKGS
ncbi:hypothetical protein EVAR_71589_1 [Eumeta japonica]|uniref:Uncharacterized protein n=1 Tax=Eumeta variegata TaxID=151549 RepID=A0A4C1SFC5_EUMVA|nr:hypothetical protein EVAR_71589_1 [Eumeta japonica]